MTLDIERHPGLPTNDLAFLPQVHAFHHGVPSDEAKAQTSVRTRVSRFCRLVRGFSNLSSFSLRLGLAPSRSVGRSTLVHLLDRLPKTCTSIELDTYCQDHRSEDKQVHVCDSIRRILPRMQHVRIRIGAMCSNIFGTSTTTDDGTRVFSPIVLPNIKSLVLSCSAPFGMLIQHCGDTDAQPLAKGSEWPHEYVWPSITRDLELFVEQNPEAAQNAKIYAMCTTDANPRTQACVTDIRVDMVAKEGWAFLIFPLDHMVGDRLWYRVRLRDGSEIMTSLRDIEVLTEGSIWVDTIGGVRVPSDIFDPEKAVKKPLSWQPLDEWTARNPGHPQPVALLNEEELGRKLKWAEKRIGADYLSNRPIKEMTPQGWVRTHDGYRLERV